MSTIIRQIAICLGLVVLLDLPASFAGQKFAIVVGVNDSPGFRLPGGARARPLAGAERDAEAFTQLLRERFGFPAERIQILQGKAATREAVAIAMAKVLKEAADPEDQVVFYFSGHGTQLADRAPLDEPDELDEALCLFDTEASGANTLLDDELGRWLDALPARRATVVLDCCHSGTGTKELGDDVIARYLPSVSSMSEQVAQGGQRSMSWIELLGGQKSLDRQRTAFFACQPNQQAYERRLLELKPVERRGQFSYYLASSFTNTAADRDANGIVSNREALEFVQSQLDKSFNKLRSQPQDRQQPALEADRPDESPF